MVKTSVVATCMCAVLAASSVSAFNAPSATRSICSRVTARNAMTMRWGLEAKGVANKVARMSPFSRQNLLGLQSFSLDYMKHFLEENDPNTYFYLCTAKWKFT